MTERPETLEAILGAGAGGPLTAPGPWTQYAGYLVYPGGVVIGAGANKGNGTLNTGALYINGTLLDLTQYLRLSGGTLTGLLTLALDPSNALDAATKGYVDSRITSVSGIFSGYLPLTGGTLTGALTVGGALIVNGAMTANGTMTLSADPTTILQAATKRYVDNQITIVNGTFANYLPKTGGTITGTLTVNGALTAGSTVTLSADPIVPLQAATKQYVDGLTSAGISIPDAPSTGITYGRNNAAWSNVIDAGTY